CRDRQVQHVAGRPGDPEGDVQLVIVRREVAYAAQLAGERPACGRFEGVVEFDAALDAGRAWHVRLGGRIDQATQVEHGLHLRIAPADQQEAFQTGALVAVREWSRRANLDARRPEVVLVAEGEQADLDGGPQVVG